MAKEYIEREALYEKAYWHGERPDFGNPCAEGVDAVDIADVDAIPAADVVEVVRCKDCKYRVNDWSDGGPCCGNLHAGMTASLEIKDDDFCSYGERRDSNGRT